MQIYALRLKAGQDLKRELATFTQLHDLRAGFVLTCVGSLKRAALRHAGSDATTEYDEPFEIVSLAGTLSVGSSLHLHMSISDGGGAVLGGHLQEGTLIDTSAEIVIGDADHLVFTREPDPKTGFLELVIADR
ncbi:MAG: DNA-binding protein [Blastochloris sp.]|nr:DNA-binding protein [Blastochloris sp.]